MLLSSNDVAGLHHYWLQLFDEVLVPKLFVDSLNGPFLAYTVHGVVLSNVDLMFPSW
jgi:hypothetical protein